jgi:hypothetical protein
LPAQMNPGPRARSQRGRRCQVRLPPFQPGGSHRCTGGRAACRGRFEQLVGESVMAGRSSTSSLWATWR